MKKKITYILIILTIAILGLTMTGCSPKHNDKFSIDKVKTFTLETTRDQVFDSIGEPLAYDSEKVDWEKHGYDLLVYSSEDTQILDWYKNRSKFVANLPGFSENLHWSNKSWDRKYYTGTADPLESSPFNYVLVQIKFKQFKLFSIEIVQYNENKLGKDIMYELHREEIVE